VDIVVVSKDLRANYVVLDSLNQVMSIGTSSQVITSGSNIKTSVEYLKKGKYRLIVYPERRGQNGTLDIWFTGPIRAVQRESVPLIIKENKWEQATERQIEFQAVSGNGFIVYEFETKKDTPIDISLFRQDWFGSFRLFSASGQQVGYPQQSVGTDSYQVTNLRTGKYYIVLATNSLKYPTFKLVVVGAISELVRR
jgi:hypothetical protein